MTDASAGRRTLTQRLERWLEFVFYSGVELSVLGSPALLVLLYRPFYDVDANAIAGLSTIVFGTCWLALFRGGYLPAGEYPRLGDLDSVPLRGLYLSLTVLVATWIGAFGWQLFGTLVAAVVLPIGCTWLALAAFPFVWRGERVR